MSYTKLKLLNGYPRLARSRLSSMQSRADGEREDSSHYVFNHVFEHVIVSLLHECCERNDFDDMCCQPILQQRHVSMRRAQTCKRPGRTSGVARR